MKTIDTYVVTSEYSYWEWDSNYGRDFENYVFKIFGVFPDRETAVNAVDRAPLTRLMYEDHEVKEWIEQIALEILDDLLMEAHIKSTCDETAKLGGLVTEEYKDDECHTRTIIFSNLSEERKVVIELKINKTRMNVPDINECVTNIKEV